LKGLVFAIQLKVDLQYWPEILEEKRERFAIGNNQKSANNALRTGINDRLF
jgi:hypothetical protein